MLAVGYVSYFQFDEIACAKLAVDGQIEQCEIAGFTAQLQPDSDRPDISQPERHFLAGQFPFVPGFTMLNSGIRFHDDLLMKKDHHCARLEGSESRWD